MTIAMLMIGPALSGYVAAAGPTVGFFDPYAPFSSPLQRVEFVEELATVLSQGANEKVVGKAYSKAADAARHLESGELQVAIVAPQFFAQRRQTLEVLMVGTRDGSPYCPYSLYVRSKSRVSSLRKLKGARLALIGDSVADRRFVFNTVLSGEIRNPRYFRKVVSVPDIAGAIGTLRFKQAEAFFGPDLDYGQHFTKGAPRKLTAAGRTLCSLLVVDRRLPESQRVDLRRVVSRSMTNLMPILGRIGLDNLVLPPRGEIERLSDAIDTKTEKYARAVPLLIGPTEPDDKQVEERIDEVAPERLPGPSGLVVERDGI